MFSLILYFCISPLSFSFPYNFIIMSDSYFIIVENQSITNTTTKHPTNPTNHGIIKDRKFALFFRSRIIAVIIMTNHANIIIYPNGTKKTYPLHNLLHREKFQEMQTPTPVMLSNYQEFLAEILILPIIFF